MAALAVLGCFTISFPAFIYFKMAALRDSSGVWKPTFHLAGPTLVRLQGRQESLASRCDVRQVWLVGAKVLADLWLPENQTLPFAIFNGAFLQLRVRVALPGCTLCACDSLVSCWCRRTGLALGAICGDTDIGAFASGVPSLRACARQRAGAVVSACSAVRHMCVNVRAPASHALLSVEKSALHSDSLVWLM